MFLVRLGEAPFELPEIELCKFASDRLSERRFVLELRLFILVPFPFPLFTFFREGDFPEFTKDETGEPSATPEKRPPRFAGTEVLARGRFRVLGLLDALPAEL